MDRNTFNIVLLSLGFALIFTAFGTCEIIEKIVLENFGINGYISQSIIYLTFAISNWFVPPVIAVTGPKYAMVFASIVHRPTAFWIYFGSALLGFSGAILWVSENNYKAIMSTDETISRNIGFFAILFPMHNFVGNLYVWYRFKEDKIEISDCSREKIFLLLFTTSVLGLVLLGIMDDKRSPDPGAYRTPSKVTQGSGEKDGPLQAFKISLGLLCRKEMLLLFVVTAYSGILVMFVGAVYSTSIGHTQQLGEMAKPLMGLHGLMIGISEVLGGICIFKFGKWSMHLPGIFEPLYLLGTVFHVTAYVLSYLNLPLKSPVIETNELSFIAPPSASVVLVTSFLLGIGLAFFFSQLLTLMSLMFSENFAPAFAMTKCFYSLSAALGFYYTNYLPLSYQTAILGLSCIAAAISYSVVRQIYQQRSFHTLSNLE